jgi:hypothetical protein
LRRRTRIEHHDDRRALISGNVGGTGGSDQFAEDEINIRRGQNMPDIVARPDFPAIRELSVEAFEVVKKVTHAGIRYLLAIRA